MASQRITCPDCKSVLKPAKPVSDGKKVKCPKCGNFFTTPGLRDDDASPAKKATAKKMAKEAIKKAGNSSPPPKKPAVEAEDEDGGVYGYIPEDEKADEDKPHIEYAPDMSIKDLRGPAQAAVVAPSNLMLLIGGLCCLSNIFLIGFSFWPMVFSDSVVNWQKVLTDHYKEKQDKSAVQRIEGMKEFKDVKDKDLDIIHDAEHDEYIWRFVAMAGFILLLIYNGIAIIGAVRMQNLESRRWGIAASVMTLLPMGAGGLSFLLGGIFYYTIGSWILDEMNGYYSIGIGVLPYLFALYVGATSLRILMSQDVIDGFSYVAE